MFFKNKKEEKFEGVHSTVSYGWAIQHTQRFLEHSKSVNDDLLVIEYVMNVVRKDIEVDSLSRYLYKQPNLYKDENYHLMPQTIFTENGSEISLTGDEEFVKVELNKSCVVSYISKLQSIFEMIVYFKKEKMEEKHYNFSRYFKEIDVCYVWHHLHSASMGVTRGEGEIIANQVSLVKAYPHLNTDGQYWLNAHTGEQLMLVHDFRIAILYELSRMKFNLQNKEKDALK